MFIPESSKINMIDPNSAPSSSLETLEPIGERTVLPTGSVLQTPAAATVEALQAIDPRVRYFSTDMALANAAPRNYEYYRGVVDTIGARVQQDFPGQDMAVRGTVASLTERFPFWYDGQTNTVYDMQSVLDILRTGSDTGGDTTMVGPIAPDGELNVETEEWLGSHIRRVVTELDGDPKLDRVFPVLIVYHPRAFDDPTGWQTHRTQQLTGGADERIVAIYITDKVLPAQSVSAFAQPGLGAAVEAGSDVLPTE